MVLVPFCLESRDVEQVASEIAPAVRHVLRTRGFATSVGAQSAGPESMSLVDYLIQRWGVDKGQAATDTAHMLQALEAEPSKLDRAQIYKNLAVASPLSKADSAPRGWSDARAAEHADAIQSAINEGRLVSAAALESHQSGTFSAPEGNQRYGTEPVSEQGIPRVETEGVGAAIWPGGAADGSSGTPSSPDQASSPPLGPPGPPHSGGGGMADGAPDYRRGLSLSEILNLVRNGTNSEADFARVFTERSLARGKLSQVNQATDGDAAVRGLQLYRLGLTEPGPRL